MRPGAGTTPLPEVPFGDRLNCEVFLLDAAQLGQERAERHWKIFEDLRAELGDADYLGALQRLRGAYPHETGLLEISAYLIG